MESISRSPISYSLVFNSNSHSISVPNSSSYCAIISCCLILYDSQSTSSSLYCWFDRPLHLRLIVISKSTSIDFFRCSCAIGLSIYTSAISLSYSTRNCLYLRSEAPSLHIYCWHSGSSNRHFHSTDWWSIIPS